jgi:hypothetical protein
LYMFVQSPKTWHKNQVEGFTKQNVVSKI